VLRSSVVSVALLTLFGCVKPDVSYISITENPPAHKCVDVGPIDVASQDKDEQDARKDAEEDLRRAAAWIGGNHVILETEEADDVQLGVGFGGKGRKVTLTGRALKCDKPGKKKH
jgi:hypothetical protein